MHKLEPTENPTAVFSELRTWDWHSYPKDSIFILDDMNYHQLKFLQASNPDFRKDLISIRKFHRFSCRLRSWTSCRTARMMTVSSY